MRRFVGIYHTSPFAGMTPVGEWLLRRWYDVRDLDHGTVFYVPEWRRTSRWKSSVLRWLCPVTPDTSYADWCATQSAYHGQFMPLRSIDTARFYVRHHADGLYAITQAKHQG